MANDIHPDGALNALATAGRAGAYASNIERDVLRRGMPNRVEARNLLICLSP